MTRLKTTLTRLVHGYAECDLAILELKIAAKLKPEEAKLTKCESAALVAMTKERLIELCERAFNG